MSDKEHSQFIGAVQQVFVSGIAIPAVQWHIATTLFQTDGEDRFSAEATRRNELLQRLNERLLLGGGDVHVVNVSPSLEYLSRFLMNSLREGIYF